MKKLFVLVPVLALLAAPAMTKEVAEVAQKDYPVLDTTIWVSQEADPELCVKVNTPVAWCDYGSNNEVCLPTSEVSEKMFVVHERNHRTYARIVTTQSGDGQSAELKLIIVRSEAVKQEWLARLRAARPVADVIPAIKKRK